MPQLALFASKCPQCQQTIRAGDPCERKFGKIKGMVHAPKCPPQIQAKSESDSSPIAQFARSKSNTYVLPETTTTPFTRLAVPEGKNYLPYQEEGIRLMLARRNTLLADEMGLGKTVQAIGLINNSPEIFRVLIVAPASLRYNWRNELRTWLTRKLHIALLPEEIYHQIGIVSFNQLSKISNTSEWDLVIVDESHAIKNPEAKRTKTVQELKSRAKRVILASGSPLENRTHELWTSLQMLDPEFWDGPGIKDGRHVGLGEGAGYLPYVTRYSGAKMSFYWITLGKKADGTLKRKKKHFFDIGESTNMEELHGKLRASCMIRRLKKDVLPQLPPKRRSLIVLPPPEGDLLEREHAAFKATGLDYKSDIGQLTKAKIMFTELAKVRHDVGLAKVPYVLEYISNIQENGVNKIIVFAHHKDVIAALSDAWGLQCAVLTGDTPQDVREANVKRFQTDPDCRIFLGSLGAAGTGITLTASSLVVFAEIDWKDPRQAEDRAHRIGQTQSVDIHTLVFDWSVDANMARAMIRKIEISEKTLDGVEVTNLAIGLESDSLVEEEGEV